MPLIHLPIDVKIYLWEYEHKPSGQSRDNPAKYVHNTEICFEMDEMDAIEIFAQ